eukprot:GILI01038114.1.p1 GENE.GILI01038114.1~~GILI01038114.1.p1  ORF type:complete len:264 (-),score=47.76 GILI01038114.1:31-822(-)
MAESDLHAEVERLRKRVKALEKEKEEMIESFQTTSSVLLNKIRILEDERDKLLADSVQSAKINPSPPPSLPPLPSNRSRKKSVTDPRSPTDSSTPSEFFEAVENVDISSLTLLCENDSVLNYKKEEGGDTCMHIAARKGSLELLTFFVSKGADIDPLNANGETPLYVAAEAGQERFVVHLVELGASLDVQNKAGATALHAAAKGGHTPICSYLISQGANHDIKNLLGDTALQIAARSGQHHVVLALSSRGAALRPSSARASSR